MQPSRMLWSRIILLCSVLLPFLASLVVAFSTTSTPRVQIVAIDTSLYSHSNNNKWDDEDADADTRRQLTILSRRKLLTNSMVIASIIASSTANNPRASAADENKIRQWAPPASQAASVELENGLLESRVISNVLNPPPYGMEGPDIFYPSWFAGTWKVRSETKSVQAPCGIPLFGGNATYNRAINDIGNVLQYESRFILDENGRVIADREYNVKSIAKVAMGENSVVDVSMATPNQFSCLLAPQGAPSMMRVDLIVLNRRQETVSETQFDCSEVVQEIVSPVGMDRPKQQQQAALRKDVETTSLYNYQPEKDAVRCQQRSAAFLLPSNENPMAMKMWQASGGRAIDVRFYDVTYTRNN